LPFVDRAESRRWAARWDQAMPSAFTHAVFAASLGSMMVPDRKRLVAIGALCAVLPDADVIAFSFGIPYAHMLGHRGLSHSLAFAACLAVLLTWALARGEHELPALRVSLFCFLAIASHGLLDALTDGGLGIAFFAPFSSERYFFPWRPIAVSPISVRRFFSQRGLAILANEFVTVWMPALGLFAMGILWRRRTVRTLRP
jgi:inner membrane protein